MARGCSTVVGGVGLLPSLLLPPELGDAAAAAAPGTTAGTAAQCRPGVACRVLSVLAKDETAAAAITHCYYAYRRRTLQGRTSLSHAHPLSLPTHLLLRRAAAAALACRRSAGVAG